MSDYAPFVERARQAMEERDDAALLHAYADLCRAAIANEDGERALLAMMDAAEVAFSEKSSLRSNPRLLRSLFPEMSAPVFADFAYTAGLAALTHLGHRDPYVHGRWCFVAGATVVDEAPVEAAEALFQLGRLHQDYGDIEAAIGAYKAASGALKSQPDEVQRKHHVVLASALARLGALSIVAGNASAMYADDALNVAVKSIEWAESDLLGEAAEEFDSLAAIERLKEVRRGIAGVITGLESPMSGNKPAFGALSAERQLETKEAIEKLRSRAQELRGEVRELYGLVQSFVQTEQLKVLRQQQTQAQQQLDADKQAQEQKQRFEQATALLASAFAGPALVLSLYGADILLPGKNHLLGTIIALVLSVFAAVAIAFLALALLGGSARGGVSILIEAFHSSDDGSTERKSMRSFASADSAGAVTDEQANPAYN